MTLLVVLGVIDIIVGGVLALSPGVPMVASGLLLALGVISLLKSIYSIGTAVGAGFYLDALGWLDLIAGIFLLMAYLGLVFGFFLYVGIIMVLKGIYSFAMGATS